ncbi:hypothetical protein [Vibrio brasiliensis]
MASGEWQVASGEWRVASGEWRANCEGLSLCANPFLLNTDRNQYYQQLLTHAQSTLGAKRSSVSLSLYF